MAIVMIKMEKCRYFWNFIQWQILQIIHFYFAINNSKRKHLIVSGEGQKNVYREWPSPPKRWKMKIW